MLLRTLALPPAGRAEAISRYWQQPGTRELAELLIDLEEDRRIALDLAFVLKEGLSPGLREGDQDVG